MTTANNYTEDNVRSLERLESVRLRPTQYVHDQEEAGITHQAKEAIDNSIDELWQLFGTMLALGLLRITLCRDVARDTFQLIVRDNGRGIPLGKLVDILTKLNTSGKYDVRAYDTSAGLFGVGVKVTAGLSRFFRCLSYRPDGVGSLLVEQGVHAMKPELAPAVGQTGVTIVYEPDSEIFSGIAQYAETGYLGLVDLLKKYAYFTPYPIEFRVSDTPIPAAFWKSSIAKARGMINTVEEQAAVLWLAASHDKEEWLRHHWHVTRPYSGSWEFHKQTPVTDSLRAWQIIIHHVKFEQKGDTFGMINNVPIDKASSDNIAVTFEQIAAYLAPRITDTAVRKYFLESYRIPLFVAVNIKFSGAQFTGTLKDGFKSASFREIYRAELQSQFGSAAGGRVLAEIFAAIEDDITSRYMLSLSSVGKTKVNMNRLFMELNRGDAFDNCSTKDRKSAELFLVEGKSAGGSSGHDAEIQAIYQLSGKPKNVIRSGVDHRTRVAEILKNDIYQDIFKILNYDPLKPNMANLNFGRCFTMADGD